MRSKWRGTKSPKGSKAGSQCQSGGDFTPEAPLCSMESDSAPGSVTLGTGWAGVPLLVKKGVLWHTESQLCLGGCIPGNRLTHCWVKGSAARLLGLAKIPASMCQGAAQLPKDRGAEGRALAPAKYRWKEKSSVKGRVRVLFIFTLEFTQPFVGFFPALCR